MIIEQIITATLNQIARAADSQSSETSDIAAARFECENARKACDNIPLYAVTRDQIYQVNEARRIWNDAGRVVLKALVGGDDDDRLMREIINALWSAISLELLIRASQRKLAENEGHGAVISSAHLAVH